MAHHPTSNELSETPFTPPAMASLQALTDRLNQLSDQFRELRDGVQRAIRIAAEDPEMALTRARKMLEYVVRDVFERRIKEPPGTRPLENLLQILVKDGHFPVRLDAYATTVRKLGNVGTHNFNETITSADVLQSLTQLMPILEWYFEEEKPDAGISLGLAAPRVEAVRPQTAEVSPSPKKSGGDDAVIPKGLRSFDATDSDSFLRLLPGPRDSDGLPDSLRFWKQRVEATDELTFTVGVIYGPSGCGKSSLMKAGLIPRLSSNVIPIYVEATADDTEARLLKGLRRRFRSLPVDLALPQTMAALRQEQGLESGHKVLIVLDQFEQWLHAKRMEQDTELSLALRQCDGDRVQCITMVRDDFWLALSRFMEDLDLRLVVGENAALVDLFDLIHARKVLVEFGRAFGRLPNDLNSLSKEHEAFLKKVVDGLAQDGRVIPVRLALFAEMIKGRPWTTATLKEIGGTAGVGMTFLEETFNSTTLKHHQKAARPVLNSLLPEQGSDIKGHMRSRQELLEASGYRDRPREFDDLIRILDNEVRLITPTAPEGASEEMRAARDEHDRPRPLDANEPAVSAQVPLPNRYYQLTHDYLVHSLRDWLNRKQKETRQGRAELRLADTTVAWQAKPAARLLPSIWEYLWIRALTDKKKWSPPQRKMMRKAGRRHGVRAGIAAAVLLIVTLSGVAVAERIEERRRSERASALVEQLVAADIVQVPRILERLGDYRRWAQPLLEVEETKIEPGSTRQLRVALAQLSLGEDKVNYLRDQLLVVAPKEFPVLRDALAAHKSTVAEPLWDAALDSNRDAQQRFQAACALATYAPHDDRWSRVNAFVANHLVARQASDFLAWREALRPAKEKLIKILASTHADTAVEKLHRSFATETLSDYGADDTELLVHLVADSESFQFPVIFDKLLANPVRAVTLAEAELTKPGSPKLSEEEKERRGCRQANLAVALYRLGKPDDVWPLLRFSPDPRARSNIVHWLVKLGGKPQPVVQRIETETDVTIRRALLSLLGEFSDAQLNAAQRQSLIDKLIASYETEPDSGLHAAAEWLLRKWGQGQRIQETLQRLRGKKDESSPGKAVEARQWYVNSQGQTFVILDAGEVSMGSTQKSDPEHRPEEKMHRCRIGRRIAVCATEVTKAQYRICQQAIKCTDLANDPKLANIVCTDDSPQTNLTWYEAAQYCNWLSRQEGLPESYRPNEHGKYGSGMKPVDKYLELPGYRLLTEAEWEYACRAGTTTSRYYGRSVDLLRHYASYQDNAQRRTWPVGTRKPNDYGLFDMLGNAIEWVDDPYSDGTSKVSVDSGITKPLDDSVRRVLRGGGYFTQPVYVRSAGRTSNQPSYQSTYIGFRVARTCR